MALFVLLICIINMVLSNDLDSNCSSIDISKWFEYPIDNFSNPTIESMISISSRLLRDTNVFVINPFLSSIGLSILQRDMLSTHYNKQEIYRSVFQDHGDLDTFPDINHSRNRVGFVRLGHTNRNDLHESFEHLYAYKPLLSFLNRIINKSGIYGDNQLYLSIDREGAIYSLFAEPHDHGSWSFKINMNQIYLNDKLNK